MRILNGLLRLNRIHSPDNEAFRQPAEDLHAVMVRFYDLLGQIQLVCVEGQIYINDIRVRMDNRLAGAAQFGNDLGRHACGGLSIAQPLDPPRVRRLVDAIAADPAEEHALAALQTAINGAGIEGVHVLGVFRLRLGSERKEAPTEKQLHDAVERAQMVTSEAWEAMAGNRAPNPLPIRRIVNDLVDLGDTASLLREIEMMADDPRDELAHARHSLRVTAYAILVGRALGLHAANLADLGVAAMYHDIGYAARREGQAIPFGRHGSTGLRLLLKQRGFHPAKLKRLLACVEHHRPFSASAGARPPSLYARIIHVVDDFETYTRNRVPNPIYGAAEALARMATRAGTEYDPVVFQVFVNCLGLFPPGTHMRLADGRIVMATSGARDADRFAKPICRIVRNADGSRPPEAVDIDLAVEGRVAQVVSASMAAARAPSPR